MDGSVLEEKSPFKMLELTSKMDWVSCIISIAEIASKKIGVLSIKYLSPEVALCISINLLPCMDYCCHFWAGAPMCYLELLDKLQKQICRTVGPSLAVSLESLALCQNEASLSLKWGWQLHCQWSYLLAGVLLCY